MKHIGPSNVLVFISARNLSTRGKYTWQILPIILDMLASRELHWTTEVMAMIDYFVLVEHRGQGVGNALYPAALNDSDAANVRRTL